ncbi:hypothetical protein SEA_SPEEDDEMON_840 [Gordonia phage SpeedDemon]|uniref:Uncharacterized protein n=1 Tax=Gordonia phage Bantam TaxID=1887641 RepID=A0A1B3AYF3_9CAUD|nr:hypothetical protein BIZ77_gp096 [Gordonia phage Bantam]AOE43772.1 hypothetical protein SEA_BANTAM_83 [Gordonia phage Bantam]QNL30534.1 hypothetical protein SEA_SPEEDDEMON_840 [Gordonia phage SpeedDemon]
MADIFDLTEHGLSREDTEKLATTVEQLPPDVKSTKLFLLLVYLKSTVAAIAAQLPDGPERDAAARAIRTVVNYSEAHFMASRGEA